MMMNITVPGNPTFCRIDQNTNMKNKQRGFRGKKSGFDFLLTD